MTHEQAHKILDRIKDGWLYPEFIVNQALWLTGDLDAHEAMRGERLAQALPGKGSAAWGCISERVVEANYCRHRAHPWLGGCN